MMFRTTFFSRNARDFSAFTYHKSAIAKHTVKPKEVEQLLIDVTMGQVTQVEKRLEDKPALTLFSARVIDNAHRKFIDISALQYALWAGDWHMWNVLLKFMPPDEAYTQWESWKKLGTEHGHQFSFSDLISTLDVYLTNFDSWSCEQLGIQWCQAVGQAQANSVAHVAQQMCHPTRSFDPCPTFDEPYFPRNLSLVDGSQLFPLKRCPAGFLGKDFAIFRWNKSAAGIGTMAPCPNARITAITDLAALKSLQEVTEAKRLSFVEQIEPHPQSFRF